MLLYSIGRDPGAAYTWRLVSVKSDKLRLQASCPRRAGTRLNNVAMTGEICCDERRPTHGLYGAMVLENNQCVSDDAL